MPKDCRPIAGNENGWKATIRGLVAGAPTATSSPRPQDTGDNKTAKKIARTQRNELAFNPRGGNDDTRDQAVRAQRCAVMCSWLSRTCPESATRASTRGAEQSGPADAHRDAARSPK